MNSLLRTLFILATLLASVNTRAQSKGNQRLDSLIKAQDFEPALSFLNHSKAEFLDLNYTDSLVQFIFYEGRIKSEITSSKEALQSAKDLAENIEKNTENKFVKKSVYIELGSLCDYLGETKKALEYNEKALEIALKAPIERDSELALIENNIGTLYRKLGDIGNAIIHVRKSRELYYSDEISSHEEKYIVNNSLGGLMWFSSKLDSASYYYCLAYDEIILADSAVVNLYYRPALLKNNIAAIHGMNGNSEKSIEAMDQAISLMGKYLNEDIPNAKRESAQKFYFQLIDNLGGAYKKLGDYQKSKKLIEFSYNQKKAKFNDDSPEIFKGEILMGQIELALLNYKEAEEHLVEGIRRLNKTESSNTFWRADAHHYLGSLYEQTEKDNLAAENYLLAEEYFEEALQGSFDEIYLDFVIFAAPFYARIGNEEKALELAEKALNYLESTSGTENPLTYAQHINVGEVNYILGNYKKAISYSKEALNSLETKEGIGTRIDSINVNFKKPLAIILKEKSRLKMLEIVTLEDLQETYSELNSVVDILEKRKSILIDEEAVSVLISDYDDSFEFLKDVSAQLYAQTAEEEYLNKIINLNESSLYHKIRSQLNDQTLYSGIPPEVLDEENVLKNKLTNWEENDEGVKAFFEAEKNWTQFLNNLRSNYPKYFSLKYESLNFPISEIQKRIPANTSVVRYIYINEDIYALILDENQKTFIPLNSIGVNQNIEKLAKENISLDESSKALFELYESLWKPIEEKIKHKNVVIIPEKELFNVSFESLITQPVEDYEGLISSSLLMKYFISYNYSLFLLSEHSDETSDWKNLAAFAPGFDDSMKDKYKKTLQDSLSFDFSYLQLLPQPFALQLANESADLFNGNAYIKENSTARVFKKNAGGHNIIFIGTHAEANNVYPSMSKFIFAKENGSEQNEIYNHELYGLDLRSNLTILAACETGKPAHQPGEGMISMAHAFNYSGSKSILTSLWKIDEKASVTIVKLFCENLEKGLSKSEALQKAKIQYLKSEKGRTLAPQYWSGLVLLGNTEPISIPSSNSSIWIYLLIGLATIILIFFLTKYQSNQMS